MLIGGQGGLGLKLVRRDGTVLRSIGQPGGGAKDFIDSALGVAPSDDYVFVADVSGYRVLVYDAALSRHVYTIDQGAISEEVRQQTACTLKAFDSSKGYQGPSCFNPHGLAWTASFGGRLFVADADNACVLVFNRAWELVRTIRDASLFTMPRGLTITPSGRLLVAERTRLVLLTLNGRLLHALDIPNSVNMLGVSADAQQAYIADVQANKVFVVTTAARHPSESAPAAVEAADAGEL